VADEATALALAGSAKHGVKLMVAFAPAAPVMPGGRVQVQQVLINLTKNASEAFRDTPSEDPKKTIRTRAECGRVQFIVEDNGSGLPQEIRDLMYKTFTTTKGDGIRFGLPVCRILEAHESELCAECNAAGGATFGFTVPSSEPVKESKLAYA